MQLRRAVHPYRHRPPARRGDRCAARPVERDRPRRRSLLPPETSSTGSSTTSTSPAMRSNPGLRLQPLGPAPHAGQRARRLRARRRRERETRRARPPVLVLLPVQRLQQHARGRLGDDPARLRRPGCARCARRPTGRGRVQLARGSGARRVGRREARAGRRAPRRLSGSGLSCEQVLGRAVARELGGGRSRLRRHARPAPRALAAGPDDPERRGCGEGRVSVDRLRGPLGRAAEGVLQRADRPEPEDAVDEADHLVRRLARPELRGADGRGFRYRDDRLLLLRGREGLEGARAAPQQPRSARHYPRRRPGPRGLRGRPCDLDSGRAAAHRASAVVGPDHLCIREDVRQAPRPLPRARRAPRSDRGRHHVRAVAAARRARPDRKRVG